MHHPKWDEQPLLIIYLKLEQTATPEEILQFMDGQSQSGGGPMTWYSSMQSRTPLPARSLKPRHAISSINIDCRPMQLKEVKQLE